MEVGNRKTWNLGSVPELGNNLLRHWERDFAPFCPVSTYLGVKLDRSFRFHRHIKTKSSIKLRTVEATVGRGWGAKAKTLRIASLLLNIFHI